MGMKLKYPLNLFAPLKNNSDAATLALNIPVSCFRGNLVQVEESMDRLPEQSYKESLKNTILKHEEIFKQQVRELHRVYKVQKMLMCELRNKEMKLHSLKTGAPKAATDARARLWSSASTSETSHSEHGTSNRNKNNTTAAPSSQELSISSENSLRMQKGFDLEQPAEEESQEVATEVRPQGQKNFFWKQFRESPSQKCDDSSMDVDSEIELTLSIGCSATKKKATLWLHEDDVGLDCSKPATNQNQASSWAGERREMHWSYC